MSDLSAETTSQILISYSREDREPVIQLYNSLEEHLGLKPRGSVFHVRSSARIGCMLQHTWRVEPIGFSHWGYFQLTAVDDKHHRVM